MAVLAVYGSRDHVQPVRWFEAHQTPVGSCTAAYHDQEPPGGPGGFFDGVQQTAGLVVAPWNARMASSPPPPHSPRVTRVWWTNWTATTTGTSGRADATVRQMRWTLPTARQAYGRALSGMPAPVSDEALKQLKFAELLPPALAAATLAVRAADPVGCAVVADSTVVAAGHRPA